MNKVIIRDLCPNHKRKYNSANHDLRDVASKLTVADRRGQSEYVKILLKDLEKRKNELAFVIKTIVECENCGYYG